MLLRNGLPAVRRNLHPTILTLLAWHDIGKFTRTFQCKVPDLWPPTLGAFRAVTRSHGHDSAGYALLCGDLEDLARDLLRGWPEQGRAVLRAACGHHGRPPKPLDAISAEEACDTCVTAATAFAHAARDLMGWHPAPAPSRIEATRLAWQLAGLAVAADWIGSNENWFAPHPAPVPLADYWNAHALPRAERAVAGAGLLPRTPAMQVRLHDLAPHAGEPTPLQALAATIALPNGPALVVVEDQTGAGKTEAALLIAHRMMAAGHARGLFVALPTMATANAMYARLATAYRSLFADGADPSLVLAHGRRALHQGFQRSILSPASPSRVFDDDLAEPAEAQCAAWIASDRRRAFLADVGVGTIDQALLAVLPSRHAALRQFGLARLVLIVDEAHAYDAYMATELETLVAFHAALGGSTIVLSATLPRVTRVALVAAFHEGAGGVASEPREMAYPLVTIAGGDGPAEIACSPRASLGRTVTVERLDGPEAAVARIVAAARDGLAVAWVRNAVDDAIAGHAAVRAEGIEAALFHARFAMGDRLAIEARAMATFGRLSTPDDRAGRVLVATQVIEQSLDVDFDLIVSDIAPIDLLIQRAGRLWRHPGRPRPPAADTPRLLVVSPEPVADAGADWLGGPFQGSGFVYPATRLWRTARVLFAAGVIEAPGDVRRLIETVYAEDDDIPPALVKASQTEQGERSCGISMARINVLRWADAYGARQPWETDVRTPTRLSEPSTTFRLGRWRDGRLRPWFEGDDPALDWALSEVSLATWRARDVKPGGAAEQAVATVKSGWSRWDREMPLLVLTPDDDGGWSGQVVNDAGQERRAIYDPARGLLMIA